MHSFHYLTLYLTKSCISRSSHCLYPIWIDLLNPDLQLWNIPRLTKKALDPHFVNVEFKTVCDSNALTSFEKLAFESVCDSKALNLWSFISLFFKHLCPIVKIFLKYEFWSIPGWVLLFFNQIHAPIFELSFLCQNESPDDLMSYMILRKWCDWTNTLLFLIRKLQIAHSNCVIICESFRRHMNLPKAFLQLFWNWIHIADTIDCCWMYFPAYRILNPIGSRTIDALWFPKLISPF
jgi:hypothetical protein